MKMKNFEIYGRAIALIEAFGDNGAQKFPIKLSYAIKKNTNTLRVLAEEIEKNREELVQKYSVEVDGEFVISEDKVEEANAEFSDLMNIEEELNILTVKIDSLSDSVELTDAQMEAIMFMIED